MKAQSMHEPRIVLCSLILVCALIFLSGWLGIVVQPAEAQQTVTLSGRVTDFAGRAVSGGYVFLDRLPGGIFAGEQYTERNGAYRFSVPPGRYQLFLSADQLSRPEPSAHRTAATKK